MDQVKRIQELISQFVADPKNSRDQVREGLEAIASDCEARLDALNEDEPED